MRAGKVWIVLLIGSLLGGLLVFSVVGMTTRTGPSGEAAGQGAKYTCSMHPQIVMDHTDTCPLCGMDLTPVRSEGSDGWEDEDPSVRLVLSETARKMADVGSAAIGRRALFHEIRTVGKIEVDETRVASVSAGLSGRVDRVLADSAGAPIGQNAPLLSIFSPDVYPAQQQFLVAYRLELRRQEQARTEPAGQDPGRDLRLSTSASPRRRLQLWGMTDKQLDDLGHSEKAQDRLTLCSPIRGTVLEKKVRAGQYVKEGDVLFTIADLSQVWLIFEVYERELGVIRLGQPVQATLESQPGRPATGTVGLVDAAINDATRTVRVRVMLENADGRFKPGMFAQTLLRVPAVSDGHPDSATAHPAVLAVPAEAVLTTGRRQLLYREIEAGKYEIVEPKLGPRAGDYFPVIAGLKDGDRVVTRGNFLLDSQFQITGKASLLYPERTPVGHGDGFTAKQRANLEGLSETERQEIAAQQICPMSGMKLASMGKPYKMTINGRTLWLCCKGCERGVKKDPEAAFRKVRLASPEAKTTR